jgi:outer membrane protein assembly factor BamB
VAPGALARPVTRARDDRRGRLYAGTSFTSEADLRPPIVYAVDLATGRRRWRAVLEPGTDLQWGAPVVEGGLVLVADTPSHPGSVPISHLHALHADTGRERWKATLGEGEQGFHTQRPLVIGGLVLTVNTSGALLAVDAGSGRRVWRERRGPYLPLIVGTSGSRVLSVSTGSGRRLAWVIKTSPGQPPEGMLCAATKWDLDP